MSPTETPREVIYLVDRFVERDEATVSLFDRGYLLGDGMFETLRAYDGKIFRVGEHLALLAEGARDLDIEIPIPESRLYEILDEAVARAACDDVYLRLTVSRGVGGAGIGFSGAESPTLSVIARPTVPYVVPEEGIVTAFTTAPRVPAACLPSSVKTSSYMPNVLARRELARASLVEGIQRAVDGQVACGIVSNVFAVTRGRLRTPHTASGCRAGVTRGAVLDVARALGIETVVGRLEPDELRNADELFFTNTVMELLPVARLDPGGGAPPAESTALGADGAGAARTYDPARPTTRALHDGLRRLRGDHR